jgi:hypothetical protein
VNGESYLSETQMQDGAFLLLSSSSLDRYARMANLLAQPILGRLREEPDSANRAVERSRRLLQELLLAGTRDLPEVELAALLAALSQTGIREVGKLLDEVGLLDAAPVLWISALARRLRQARVTTVSMNVHPFVEATRSAHLLKYDFRNSTARQPEEVPRRAIEFVV